MATKKILWAVDAFQNEKQLHHHVVLALQALSKGQKTEIQPVYLLSPDRLRLSVEFSEPWVKRYQPAAEKALQQLLSHVRIPGLLPGKVLVQNLPSLTESVKRLTRYAQTSGAEMIVLATHGRKGVSRALLGSFAESLVQHSRTPVYLVNPNTRPDSSIRKIVFPTDLSKSSRKTLEEVVQFAKARKSKIALFHQVPNPIEPVFESGVYLLGGAWVPVRNYFSRTADLREAELKKWTAYARSKGVSCSHHLGLKSRGTKDSILAFAKAEKASLIAMASQSGAISSVLLGSIARGILRESSLPVWIVHAHPRSARKGKNIDPEVRLSPTVLI